VDLRLASLVLLQGLVGRLLALLALLPALAATLASVDHLVVLLKLESVVRASAPVVALLAFLVLMVLPVVAALRVVLPLSQVVPPPMAMLATAHRAMATGTAEDTAICLMGSMRMAVRMPLATLAATTLPIIGEVRTGAF
jgi:hypothetical protein